MQEGAQDGFCTSYLIKATCTKYTRKKLYDQAAELYFQSIGIRAIIMIVPMMCTVV